MNQISSSRKRTIGLTYLREIKVVMEIIAKKFRNIEKHKIWKYKQERTEKGILDEHPIKQDEIDLVSPSLVWQVQELWYWLEEDLLSCPIVIVTIVNRRRYNGSTTSTNRSTVVRGDKDDYDNLVNPARLIRFCKKKGNDNNRRRWWRHERPISLHSSRNNRGQTTMSTMGITVVWCMIKQIAGRGWHIPWYRWCHHNRDMKNVPDHDESSLRPVTDRKCFLLLWIKIKTKSWDRLLNIFLLS